MINLTDQQSVMVGSAAVDELSDVIDNTSNGESSSESKIEEYTNTKSDSRMGSNSEEATQLLASNENIPPTQEISRAHEKGGGDTSMCSTPADNSIQNSSLSAQCVYNGDRKRWKKFLFHKKLFPSDVNDLNRLVIPRKYSDLYFPPLRNSQDEYYMLSFTDSEGQTWEMKYVYWPRSQSYALTRGWKAYVKNYKLQHDDILEFYELDEDSCQAKISRRYGISHFRRVEFRLFGKDISVVTDDTTKIGAKPDSIQNHQRRKNSRSDEDRAKIGSRNDDDRLSIQSNNKNTGIEPTCKKIFWRETTQR